MSGIFLAFKLFLCTMLWRKPLPCTDIPYVHTAAEFEIRSFNLRKLESILDISFTVSQTFNHL